MKEKETEHPKWGGARKGAGRKGKGAKMVSFRLRLDLIERLSVYEDRTAFFEEAIEEKLERESRRWSLQDVADYVNLQSEFNEAELLKVIERNGYKSDLDLPNGICHSKTQMVTINANGVAIVINKK